MRQKALLLLCILFLTILTACNTYEDIRPVGLWKSSSPEITIDVTADRGPYSGVYVKDGEEEEIFVVFSHLNNRFTIHGMEDDRENAIMNNYEYFHGKFTVKGDEMRYVLLPRWQNEHDIEEIIFTKVYE